MLTLSGFKAFLFFDTICPVTLKTLSDDELLAQMHKYFLANFDITGKSTSCADHHFSGFVSGSMMFHFK